ncbi:hypothetical protein STRIP9103_04585 [Streptomyces ipomoeae 91-03]|uniref:Uncharacterized protein n=1 Tax=Streptomyces ipomoeae 91-03 TaxID=698759 RepID=L1KZJ2_9ACTN|nr:hypothetical protein STRIP9103_04585 [Streptomyces ipomoeae 91-03]
MSALSPEALVALGGIADHQRVRTSRITSVLANRLGSSALDYAVAHHLLEGAEHAARARDTDRLDWYRRTTVGDLTHLSAGPHIVLNPRSAEMLRSEISETAYYLVGPDSSPASPKAHGLVRAATASATEHGFGNLLTQHAPRHLPAQPSSTRRDPPQLGPHPPPGHRLHRLHRPPRGPGPRPDPRGRPQLAQRRPRSTRRAPPHGRHLLLALARH